LGLKSLKLRAGAWQSAECPAVPFEVEGWCLAECPAIPFEVEGWRPAPLRAPRTPILPVTLIPHFFIHVPRYYTYVS